MKDSDKQKILQLCEEMKHDYKTKKRATPFQDTLFNHAVNVIDDLQSKIKNII